MNCPVDGSALALRRHGQSAVALCESCHGLWITRDQFRGFVLRGKGPTPTAKPPEPAPPVRRPRLCPGGCGYVLSRRLTHEIEVDICTHCRGIWLDAGELEQILARCKRSLSGRGSGSRTLKSVDGFLNGVNPFEGIQLLAEVLPDAAELGAAALQCVFEFLGELLGSIDF